MATEHLNKSPRAGRFQRIAADIRQAALAAFLACVVAMTVDWIATLIAASSLSLRIAFSLLIVSASFAAVFFVFVFPLFVIAAVGIRALWRIRQKPLSHGLFHSPSSFDRPSQVVPWLWTLTFSGLGFIAFSTVLTLRLGTRFREPELTALLLAVIQVLALLAIALVAIFLLRLFRYLGEHLHKTFGPFNPFGHRVAALVGLSLVGLAALITTVKVFPQLEPIIPRRWLLTLAAGALGAAMTPTFLKRWKGCRDQRSRRRTFIIATASIAVLLPLSFSYCGADPAVKATALASSPPMATGIRIVRYANDFDRDGFGSLFGETDCAMWDPSIHPMARDIPDNGIDENCQNGDFKLGVIPAYRKGERMPVPDAFRRDDYNILLVTVDTVRYDHTTLGGYDKRKGRNTTPELAKLAARSASFTFANAPSAGTMASIPAILTSRFFHSGIALDENVGRGKPPKLKPENTLISEVLHQRGYTTGAIVSHYYFNDWGMEQGFDTYDNSVGHKNEPYKVTSDALNKLAIQWIGKHQGQKWFLWVHYIDPHGRYVSHPGETEYGTSEEDIYDGELAFTDKRLGRLFDFVGHSRGGNRTIIVVTSDHGDGFREHGYINHGQDLHQEILHVPLVFHVPNIEPRKIPGPVSPIDIFPTLADLAGADISQLVIEGQSLVPQLFYGRDANERVVFAETNYGHFYRAAVTSQYKLIRNIKANSNRLWNLKKDPGEKTNIHLTDPKGLKLMSRYLDDWLERVVYARDPEANQVMSKIADHLVTKVPDSATPIEGLSFGPIAAVAYELTQTVVKDALELHVAVYFKATSRPPGSYALQVQGWKKDNPNIRIQSRRAITAKGLLPTDRWHPQELVRDRFKLNVPKSWFTDGPSENIVLGLKLTEGTQALTPSESSTQRTYPRDSNVATFGESVLTAPPSSKPPSSKPVESISTTHIQRTPNDD